MCEAVSNNAAYRELRLHIDDQYELVKTEGERQDGPYRLTIVRSPSTALIRHRFGKLSLRTRIALGLL